MYKLINTATGGTVGYTDKPNYIKRKASTGSFVKATEADAQGVAYKSTPYNLHGRDGVGAEDTVMLLPYDAGDVANDAAALGLASCDTDAITVDHEIRLAMLEHGLI